MVGQKLQQTGSLENDRVKFRYCLHSDILKFQVKFMLVFTNLLTELCKLATEKIKKLDVDFANMTLMTGGSVFNALNTNELLSKTGLKAIIQGYGTTEIGCFITVDDSTDFVPGSTGFLGPTTQIKVWDNL